MVIKTVWYLHKDRRVDQWNRIETLKINHHIYCQVVFVKGAKTIQWGKESLSTNDTKETGYSHTEK